MIKDRERAVIWIQKSDSKSKSWAQELRQDDGAELVPVKGSPIFVPVALLKAFFAGTRVDGFVFRYLNDYPALGRTLLRAFAELAAYFIVRYLHRGQVAWICHNVDRESEVNYPAISKFRRCFLSKRSIKVFVTSDLLLPHALKYLDIPPSKLDVASFGRPCPESEVDLDSARLEDLRRHVARSRLANERVGLWVGSPAGKSADGLRSFLRFVLAENDRGARHCAFVVGVVEKWVESIVGIALVQKMQEDGSLNIIGPLEVPWAEWKRFDYVWKPCDDVSLTMTALNAAAAGVFMVVHSDSFIGEFVEHYRLGVAVNANNPVIDEETFSGDRFSMHEDLWVRQSWRRGAVALIKPFTMQETS